MRLSHSTIKDIVVERPARRVVVQLAVRVAVLAACLPPVMAQAVGGSSACCCQPNQAAVAAPPGCDSTSPAGVVRQLVAAHLASQARFDSLSVRAKRRWLTDLT